MPLNGYSVGKDVVLTVNTSTGILRLMITDFDAKPVYTDLKSLPLGAPAQHMSIPAGWKGTIKLDRKDSAVDDYCAQVEATYWAGGNIATGSITETISEVDGTTSRYRYTDVNLKITDTGSWKGEKLVDQSIEFEASRRLKL